MEFKIDESKIMDYLYGNLSDTDQRKMEEALQKDDNLRSEVEELQKVMDFMGKSEDKEVIPPAFVFPGEATKHIPFVQTNAFKWASSVAAGLAVVLVVAFSTGFYISANNGNLMIGFAKNGPSNGVSKQDVKGIMQDVLTAYNAERDEKLNSLESKLSAQMKNYREEDMVSIAKHMQSNAEESRKIMAKYIRQSNKDNQQMIADYFKVSTDQQQQYLNTVLTDFTKFYNSQRKEDLEAIRTGILEYKSSNDLKQYETEMVLANLVDMVNTQNR